MGHPITRVYSHGSRQQRIDAKELAPGIDLPIAISIQNQPRVVAFDPARAGTDAVGIVVKHNRVDAGTDGFDAVAIEVDCERVYRADGVGTTKLRVCGSLDTAADFTVEFRSAIVPVEITIERVLITIR